MRETTLRGWLRGLVQLLPAIAVAGIVLVTLPRTAPVLAAVPERLALPAEAAGEPAEEPLPEEEPALPALPYADGVYTGSSRGYGGTVKVQVTMEGGYITDLQILDARHETSNFLRRAKRLLRTILDAQSWEVDAVSEATYTSRGILGAVKNALTGEVVSNPLPPQPKPAQPLVEEVFETPSVYRDGVYTASAEGFGGPVTVQVTISGDCITDITVVSHDGETTSYFSKARRVISAILETGTPEGVDAVSGATYSSTGILNAVKLALGKAATGEPEETPAETPEAPASEPETESPAEMPAESPAESIMQPTWETAQPEESTDDDPFGWARELWSSLFPESGSASSASGPEFYAGADSTASSAEETAGSTAAEPEQTAEPSGEGEGSAV